MALSKLLSLFGCGSGPKAPSTETQLRQAINADMSVVPSMRFKPKVSGRGSENVMGGAGAPRSRRTSLSRNSQGAPDLSRMSMSSDVAAANQEYARTSRANSISAAAAAVLVGGDQVDGVPAADQDTRESQTSNKSRTSLLEINANSMVRSGSPAAVTAPADI